MLNTRVDAELKSNLLGLCMTRAHVFEVTRSVHYAAMVTTSVSQNERHKKLTVTQDVPI